MEFYARIGTDGAQVTARLGGEAMTSRFIRRFASDGSYDALMAALDAGQGQEAFRAAHTLKGVAANLGFERLWAAASALTEQLRGGTVAGETAALAEAVSAQYAQVTAGIAALEDIGKSAAER